MTSDKTENDLEFAKTTWDTVKESSGTTPEAAADI